MVKKIQGFLIFFLICQSSLAQFSYRNNCIDSCSAGSGSSTMAPLMANTIFEPDSAYGPGYSFAWDFGGGFTAASPANRTGINSYTSPGKRLVRLKVVSPGKVDSSIYSKEVIIGQAPSFRLTDSTKELCTGDTYTLRLPLTISSNDFRWFPNGETSRDITVDKEGCYSVKVFANDSSGCYTESSTEVTICGSYPNAFDPNQNGNGTSGGTSANVQSPQWNLGDSLKVIFPGDGRLPSSEQGPYEAPAQIAYYPFRIKGAKYIHGALNTNGQTLVNNQGRVLANDLNGDITIDQGTVIFPKKSCKGCNSSDYYIITSRKDGNGNIQLYYSIVDLSDSSGKGGILVKNRLLQSLPSQEKILVQTYQEGFGLISIDADGKNMRTYIFDQSGISRAIVTPLPSPINSQEGTAKFSRDNSKLAVVSGNNQVTIFDMAASPPKEITQLTVGPTAYGVEFSPDGSLLYISTNGVNSELFQFFIDTTASDIEGTRQLIARAGSGEFGAMGYDPVNQAKLFISVKGERAYATIGKPNQRLSGNPQDFIDLDYQFNEFKVSKTLGYGIPNTVNNNDGGGGPQIEVECKGLDFVFKMNQDLCQDKKNTKVKWEIYRASVSTNLSPFYNDNGVIVVDPTLGQPIFTDTKTQVNIPGGIGNNINQLINVNQMKYNFPIQDFDGDGIEDNPTGYYVVVAHIWNECVDQDPAMRAEGYLLDAQVFYIQTLRPFRLKENINKIYNNILGTSGGTCNFSSYIIDSVGIEIPSILYPIPDSINLGVPKLPFLSYAWSTGDSTSKLEIPYNAEPLKIELTLTDLETGCVNTQGTTIQFYTTQKLPQSDNWYLCMDDANPQTRLQVFDETVDLNYDWSTINGNIITTNNNQFFVDVNAAGEYRVLISDDYNCTVDSTYLVGDKCLPEIIMPNVFSPNGDGNNDVLYPTWNWGNINQDISLRTIPNSIPSRFYDGANRTIIKYFRIYNRWGEKLFESKVDDLTKFNHSDEDFKDYSWDGKYGGKLVPQDTYVWEVVYESIDFPELGEQNKRGSVVVIY